MWVTEFGMVKLAKALHSRKAPSPMWVTDSGMVKFVKELQPWKAQSPIWVTEFGMVKLAKELQFWKAPFPMWVTESGMVNLANVWHHAKAIAWMCVSWFGSSTTSNSLESTMPPRRAIISLWEHTTMFGLKTTPTTVSWVIPASNTLASLASKWSSPTMISTLVVLRVSSSQGCPSLICCLSSRPVISGVNQEFSIWLEHWNVRCHGPPSKLYDFALNWLKELIACWPEVLHHASLLRCWSRITCLLQKHPREWNDSRHWPHMVYDRCVVGLLSSGN